jgi:hypothetical protein
MPVSLHPTFPRLVVALHGIARMRDGRTGALLRDPLTRRAAGYFYFFFFFFVAAAFFG